VLLFDKIVDRYFLRSRDQLVCVVSDCLDHFFVLAEFIRVWFVCRDSAGHPKFKFNEFVFLQSVEESNPVDAVAVWKVLADDREHEVLP
jgi:hypothetical protein